MTNVHHTSTKLFGKVKLTQEGYLKTTDGKYVCVKEAEDKEHGTVTANCNDNDVKTFNSKGYEGHLFDVMYSD